jgi:hypothetical protein
MSIVLVNFNKWRPITKSDTLNFDGTPSTKPERAFACDAIFVGGAGVVVAVQQDGTIGAFTVVAGEMLPIKAIRVNSTDTTATLMVALYLQ